MQSLFQLRYKLNGGPKDIVFDATDEKVAREMAIEWCKLQSFKFVILKPFYLDMKTDIARLKGEGKVVDSKAKALVKL